MDEAGQLAAIDAANILLSVANVKITKHDLKDFNELLLADRGQEIMNAVWNASSHQPDGLIEVDEVIRRALLPQEAGLPWMFDGLNKSSNGRKFGEIHTIGAGTGVGKTDLILQQADYDIRILKQKVGLFFVETDPEEVLLTMAGKADGKLYYEENHPDYDDVMGKTVAMTRYSGMCHIYDNFGLCDWPSIKSKMIYLINLGYRIFYIDHLTALATGGEKNEKEELETMMADIAEEAKRHKVLIHVISHLTTPEGKSHEEGGRVTIRQFKGSRAIGFWSHAMYGLERDQQSEGSKRFVTTIRQLKRRGFGKGVGALTFAAYNPETGCSEEQKEEPIDNPFEEEKF
jgi:twinkle protein